MNLFVPVIFSSMKLLCFLFKSNAFFPLLLVTVCRNKLILKEQEEMKMETNENVYL